MKNLLTSALLALVCAAAARAGVPSTLNYQGRLLDASGAPIEGPLAVAVAVFDAETDGTMVYTQQIAGVIAQNGLYSFEWGGAGLSDALTNDQCWLQLHVDGDTLFPRQRLVAVPYALHASRADQADQAQTAATAVIAQTALSSSNAQAVALSVADYYDLLETDAPMGAMRLGEDGTLWVNTTGDSNGWSAVGGAQYKTFTDTANWAAFDPGANGVGTDSDGFRGGVFDGRYIYFVSHHNGTAENGEVLRFDTQGAYYQASSWTTFDPGANGVGTDPDGFSGGVFDGRYVYFVPHHNGTEHHGEVLRFDTQGAFNQASSWAAYDPGANGVGVDPDGYIGGVFDGRYVYFVPWYNESVRHGEVLRFDTQGTFNQASSWAAFDPGANGVGIDPDGFTGGVFDGRYVYFAPHHNGTEAYGEVLRFDTQGTFNQASSWATYDPGAHGVGTDPDCFMGGVYDGRYIYFVPHHNGTEYHGEVLRFDTQGAFDQASAWAAFDPGANGVGTDPDGFEGGVFDGRYVYFVPNHNGTANHGEVLRFDTQGAFNQASSWATYDPGANGVGTDPDGFQGGVFDGRFIYFVPYNNGAERHGEVLRFDARQPAKTPQHIPQLRIGGSFY